MEFGSDSVHPHLRYPPASVFTYLLTQHIWFPTFRYCPVLPGVPPFWAESERGVAERVLKGQLDFHREPWPQIAPPLKELVRSMLHLDPAKRLTAPQVLGTPSHPTSA